MIDRVARIFFQIEGYLAAPHELLHVLAYRIIGKRCSYTLGQRWVQAEEKLTRQEHLFVSLLPFAVAAPVGLPCWMVWAILTIRLGLSPEPLAYFPVAPYWHQSVFFIGLIGMYY